MIFTYIIYIYIICIVLLYIYLFSYLRTWNMHIPSSCGWDFKSSRTTCASVCMIMDSIVHQQPPALSRAPSCADVRQKNQANSWNMVTRLLFRQVGLGMSGSRLSTPNRRLADQATTGKTEAELLLHGIVPTAQSVALPVPQGCCISDPGVTFAEIHQHSAAIYNASL